MYNHTRVYIHAFVYIYTDIHIYIRIHIHMHIYTHTCTHIYICMYMHTYTQIENLSNDTSECVKQHHRHTYESIYICMHIHIYMHVHVCAHPAASVSLMCILMSKNSCVTYTHAHALVTRTPVPKCTQHSLPKNAQICIHTHICTRIHMHANTNAHP